MLAFWLEDDVNHLRLGFTTGYVERKLGLDKSQGCWRFIILYYPLIFMYNQKYKKPFWTIKVGIVYPGREGPLMSLRWLQMKCGIEDYEILRALSEVDKKKADLLCTRALFSFDDYVTDVNEFEKIRAELVEAYADETI